MGEITALFGEKVMVLQVLTGSFISGVTAEDWVQKCLLAIAPLHGHLYFGLVTSTFWFGQIAVTLVLAFISAA
jgi:hypothetical protein